MRRAVVDCDYIFDVRCRSRRKLCLPWQLDSCELETITTCLPTNKIMLRYNPPQYT